MCWIVDRKNNNFSSASDAKMYDKYEIFINLSSCLFMKSIKAHDSLSS